MKRRLGDFAPACTVKLMVGGGVGRYSKKGRRVSVDPERLRRRVEELSAIYFPASTHTKARGFWEGVGEPTITVDIVQRGAAPCEKLFERARCAASGIASALHQDAVGVLVRDSSGRSRADFVEKGAARCRLSTEEVKEARARIAAIRKLI